MRITSMDILNLDHKRNNEIDIDYEPIIDKISFIGAIYSDPKFKAVYQKLQLLLLTLSENIAWSKNCSRAIILSLDIDE